jgi:hypothetical protein
METFDRPLSDFRCAPIEKPKIPRDARYANFSMAHKKSELGDSLVKVLFWKEQSSKKTRAFGFLRFYFFHEPLDWQVTD